MLDNFQITCFQYALFIQLLQLSYNPIWFSSANFDV